MALKTKKKLSLQVGPETRPELVQNDLHSFLKVKKQFPVNK